MNVFSNILNSLQIVYQKAEVKEIISPFELDGAVSGKNILIQLNKGNLFAGKDCVPIAEGEFYFIPAGTPVHARFGKSKKYVSADVECLNTQRGLSSFTRAVSSQADISAHENVFTIVQFNTKLHKSVPFFPLLNIPPLVLGADEELSWLLAHLAQEEHRDEVGKETLLQHYSHQIVIHLFRFLSTQKQFAANVEKIVYMLDNRLVKIIFYVQENLEKDLSNARLAEQVFLAADYVSQFFKGITGRNLQEYVEDQRLKKALELVMFTSETMKEIAFRVGFHDAAYFSRRFKIKFEKNALATRKNDRKEEMAVVKNN